MPDELAPDAAPVAAEPAAPAFDPLAGAIADWLESLKQQQPPFDLDVWNRLHAASADLHARLKAAH